MIIAVKDLPDTIKAALKELNFNRADIKAEAVETTSLNSWVGDGRRAFVCLVDLATGKRSVTHGSWGGPNAYNRNAVDSDERPYTIPPNVVVILGEQSSGPVSARLVANPATLTPMLPSGPTLPERATRILAVYRGWKSSYRADELARMNVTADELDALVAEGYLARNKAGATSITTKGKQACERVR